MTVSERFLRYVAFPTTSDEANPACPSTEAQRTLGQFLVAELTAIGASDAKMDEHGYVYARIPANCDEPLPVIGFIAHMDTAPGCSGENIRPSVVAYSGGDIVLNEQEGIVLRESEFPQLRSSVGKHLIVTDGTTLLGADDKAGIAEILSMAEAVLRSDRKHGELRIGFTPDEEIGRGADLFDVAGFGCDFAYTCDGGALGGIEYENFNAAAATLTVTGKNIHPGSAKGIMKNAATMAMEFHAMLPTEQVPEKTEGYEGFFHLCGMKGDVEQAQLAYIIRDHDRTRFEEKKQRFLDAAETLNRAYGERRFEAKVTDSYYNMKEKLLPHMEIVTRAEDALRRIGVEPVISPIRGGTDGARLSYMGLLCPNLCTGGENYHGHYEYIPIEDMEACVEMLKGIVYGG